MVSLIGRVLFPIQPSEDNKRVFYEHCVSQSIFISRTPTHDKTIKASLFGVTIRSRTELHTDHNRAAHLSAFSHQ